MLPCIHFQTHFFLYQPYVAQLIKEVWRNSDLFFRKVDENVPFFYVLNLEVRLRANFIFYQTIYVEEMDIHQKLRNSPNEQYF